jgi:hypothetical protein
MCGETRALQKQVVFAPKNRSNSRIVTGKWLFKNYKLTVRLKNKCGPIHKLKTIIIATNSD